MKRGVLIVVALLMLLALLARPRAAGAGVHQVWDEAHFFKIQTIEHVDQILADIHSRFGKDLMIETFPSIPDDFKQRYQEVGKEKFYEGWSIAEGRRLELNGVLILVTGEPSHLKVKAGLDTRQKAFTETDGAELADKLVAAFKARDFDGGVVQAAEFVRDRMARNLGGSEPATRPTTQPAREPLPTTRPSAVAQTQPSESTGSFR